MLRGPRRDRRIRTSGELSLLAAGRDDPLPWHGWEFEISTGQSWCDPDSIWVKTYRTTVEPGAELLKGPFVVETFPVSVEDDYVVIEM